jgi:quercetin dioxygenase-like cupin family protein
MNIELLGSGLNIAPIYWALQENPLLWNQHTARTEDKESPHHGLSDIWARFGPEERAEDGQPHDSIWYPSADILGIKQICFDVMHAVHGVELGGVLITKIPAGKKVKPHNDPGWHARRYEKYAVQITSAPGQKFCFDNEELETKPGDLFWFDNQHSHWVINPTEYERITMIICIRKGA